MVAFFQPLYARPQIALLLVLVSLVLSGNGLVAPVLSLYAASFGVASTLVGMIVTIFGVARLITNIPAGLLSQRYGLKPLLVAGPVIIVIGSIGAALATDFTWLLIFRFVQGVGSGVYMTTSLAVIAGFANAGERGRMMALYQAAILFGAGIGPAIGGFIAQHYGMTAPFWAYALVGAAAVVVAMRCEPNSPVVAETEEATKSSVGPLFWQPMMLVVCFVNFGVFFTRTAAQWQMIPLLAYEGYGMGLDVIGAALALSAIANFALLPLAGGVIDRFGARRVACLATLVTALSILLIGTASGTWSFWIGMLLLGMGSGFNGPAVAVLAADTIPRHLYGPGMGIFRTGGDMGFVLGPIVVGLATDLGPWGLVGGFMINGLLLLAGAIVLSRRALKYISRME